MRGLLVLLVACGDAESLPDADARDAALGCADDHAFEPNDTVATAWPTPVGKTVDKVSIGGLAICPASDVDHYAVTLAAPRSLAVRASWSGGSPVTLALLNAAGTPLVTGAPGGAFVRVCIPNAPPGTYAALVQTGDGTTSAAYRLDIELPPSC